MEEEREYGSYWESHLLVYKQPLVWLASSLSNRNGTTSTIYLLAILASVNALIMFIASLSLPNLLLFGVILLIVAFSLAFCIFINLSNRFKMYPNWGDREEGLYKLLCSKVGNIHFCIKNKVCYILKMRGDDPKKFYGFGIAASFLFSYIGQVLTTSAVLHLAVSTLLLTPLIIHHQIHTHIMNKNWDQLYNSISMIAKSLVDAVKSMTRRSPHKQD
ncbi:PREDICTED: uncharacterized protein LOC100636584 [Amphimedon queenslandica]|uniref:Uncharacterized protein n=1 Tax=Amphimedon queenslandica TaxID=400682 RepID=A0A1X7UK82_AMPQE|nr:PREDICTED: uncharacterized protein LOC100636584 [Amphimedon queenslandica]|eukprot:XP_003387662.1 PREDICTED: uncharacterized protein LOC100636584 [Amphimedon queenslandica]